MDFDSYSNRLSDLTEYYGEFLKKPAQQIEQKRFQVINESMQMKSVCKFPFGQLNDKRFYFSNSILLLTFGHPYLEDLRKEKNKYRNIYTVIQSKKDKFLKEGSKVIQKIQRLNILKQIYSQISLLYELNSDIKFIASGWKTTKEYIKNGCWQ